MPEKARYVTCVCTANVCRSPMAQKLLEHALKKEEDPLRSLTVISAGVSAVDGYQASQNSIRALQNVSLDLTSHRSQHITREIVARSQVIFCMTQSHRHLLREFFPGLEVSIYLIREFMPPPAEPQILDPFGQDLAAYEACRDSIVEAIPSVLRFLRGYIKSKAKD